MNFSFRTGFRELSSLLSLLQAAGRIGRNGEYEDAAIWSFTMQDDPMLIPNKGLADSVKVMKMIHRKQLEISPQLSTFAIQQEINIGSEVSEELLRNEKMKNYADVANDFHVIDSETVLVVPDEELKQQIRYRKCDWREIQRKSVSVYLWRAKKLPKLINEADDLHSLYDWNLGYDSFLGIMAGALDAKQAKNGFLIL